jgi:predicted secreted hydrolase
MRITRVLWRLAVVLIGLLVVLWWLSSEFPFNIKPIVDHTFSKLLKSDDQIFSKLLSSDDRSFSKLLSEDDKDFERALQPRPFSFPRDHGAHNTYRTEWWYFTGNLKNPFDRKFGYQLTFFRFALAADTPRSVSRWRNNQIYMAHLTLTDVKAERFYSDERFSRAGNGLAGAADNKYQVWLHDWSAAAVDDADFPIRLQAKSDQFAIDLLVQNQKKRALQGKQGLSQKSEKPGNASYYYSYTRLATEGNLTIGGDKFTVVGDSWMDREWSTSALSDEQIGWDWFALQFSDNSEMMFFQLRRKDGQLDRNSAGAIFLPDNSKIALTWQDVSITVLDTWKSPHSKAVYPSLWRVSIPAQNLEVDIVPLVNDQELNLSYRYWEGAVNINGIKDGKLISGQGYVELTGY